MTTEISSYLYSLDEIDDEMRIEAGNSFITARRTADDLVTIIDILVPETERGQGISRELFNRLLEELPSDIATIDLHDDVNPAFWENLGFRSGTYSV